MYSLVSFEKHRFWHCIHRLFAVELELHTAIPPLSEEATPHALVHPTDRWIPFTNMAEWRDYGDFDISREMCPAVILRFEGGR